MKQKENNMSVRIVIDSTADLPAGEVAVAFFAK